MQLMLLLVEVHEVHIVTEPETNPKHTLLDGEIPNLLTFTAVMEGSDIDHALIRYPRHREVELLGVGIHGLLIGSANRSDDGKEDPKDTKTQEDEKEVTHTRKKD
jgi:hypothetical protein